MANVRTTRDNVKVGAIFALDLGAGRKGTKRFAAIGKNGKYAGINMGTGNLTFTPTAKGKKRVVVVGDYNLEAVLLPPSQHKSISRISVNDDMLFTIAEGNNVYAHLGKNNDGDVVSLNLRTRDYAVGSGRGSVTIVGSYKIKGQAAA